MKIQSINNINHNHKTQNNTKNYFTKQLNADSISLSSKQIAFTNADNFKIKAQGKILELKGISLYKSASAIREDSFHIIKKSRSIQKRAQEIQEASKQIYTNARREFAKGVTLGYKPTYDPETNEIIKEFYDGDNGQLIMEEYDRYGRTTKKIIKDKQVTAVLLKSLKKGKFNTLIFDNTTGELIQYLKEAKMDFDKYSALEQFAFSGDKLLTYSYKHEEIINKHQKSEERYSYNDNKITSYHSDWSYEINGEEKASEEFIFADETVKKSSIGILNYEDSTNSYRTAQEEYLFDEDADIKACTIGLRQPKNQISATAQSIFCYSENGLEKVYLNVITNIQEKRTSAEKLYYFKNDKAERCQTEYLQQGDIEKFAKNIRI